MVLSMTKLKAIVSAIAIISFVNAMLRSNVNINVGTIEFEPVVDSLGRIRKVGRIGPQNKNNLSNKRSRENTLNSNSAVNKLSNFASSK
jgi:hypothetical protein